METQSSLAIPLPSQAARPSLAFSPADLDAVKCAARGYTVNVHDYPVPSDDPYGEWDAAIDSGRSYLCGSEMPMADFLRTHRSRVTDWQQMAFAWAWNNPGKALSLHRQSSPRLDWVVRRRGEYVDFGLPHQDSGGEKNYVSRDGVTKILVNVD